MATRPVEELEVGGRLVRVSSLDRVLWPESRTTKAELLDYYVRIAPVLLPHLESHPVTLRRFPEGVGGPSFYQTRCPPHPPWVQTQRMWTFRPTAGEVEAPLIDDLPALVWAVNLTAIELHPYLGCEGDALDRPTAVVFDLDPGPPAGLLECGRVALSLRDVLDDLGLLGVPKVSGRGGLHVYVPLAGEHAHDTTKAFAHAIALLLTERLPDLVVTRMTKSVRVGRVFVDWGQNDAGKSTVVAYSVRAMVVPTVSAPVAWDEVEAAVEAGDERALWFTPEDVLRRVEERGDLFAAALDVGQRLPEPASGAATPRRSAGSP